MPFNKINLKRHLLLMIAVSTLLSGGVSSSLGLLIAVVLSDRFAANLANSHQCQLTYSSSTSTLYPRALACLPNNQTDVTISNQIKDNFLSAIETIPTSMFATLFIGISALYLLVLVYQSKQNTHTRVHPVLPITSNPTTISVMPQPDTLTVATEAPPTLRRSASFP